MYYVLNFNVNIQREKAPLTPFRFLSSERISLTKKGKREAGNRTGQTKTKKKKSD